jgi:hypothetical protein
MLRGFLERLGRAVCALRGRHGFLEMYRVEYTNGWVNTLYRCAWCGRCTATYTERLVIR